MPLRLAFLGTGSFAEPTFRSLLGSPHEVVGLVTQPDRTGRGHHRHVNPLKVLAEEQGVAVRQPADINEAGSLASVAELGAELFVTAAYGQILKPDVIATPRLGAINLHGSILPKYRGAAPVQRAVWNGETETGVTVFQIEPKLDAGPTLGLVTTPIRPNETSGELHDRLAELAAPVALEVIDKLDRGVATPLPQVDADATKAAKLKKEDGPLDWSRPAAAVVNQCRAVQPWPKPQAWWHTDGRKPTRLLLASLEICDGAGSEGTGEPGTVLSSDGELVIACGENAVRVLKVQPAGKPAMDAADFLRGYPVRVGDRFAREG